MSPSSSTSARICARPITALLRTAVTTGGRRQPQMADTARSGVLTFGRRTTPLSREGRGERDQFCGERLNLGLPWPFAEPSARPFLLLTTGLPSATRVAPKVGSAPREDNAAATAFAISPPTGMMPPSPAALTPRGLVGDGRCSNEIARILGKSVAIGIE